MKRASFGELENICQGVGKYEQGVRKHTLRNSGMLIKEFKI